ncbi:MAG: 16S rRNA (adenine(1518)-N(6)/adenine(1519)-N(6))-dimethyltransferase RsmA, partial [Deltaproteobacteria bacterium]
KLYAKKSLGQNFLVDGNVLSRIVTAAGIDQEEMVLEIGPGKGALTELLAKKARQVLAVELDNRLVEYLGHKFLQTDNVEIIRDDILRTDLPQILSARSAGRWKVVANLPYNISSQVLFKFMENREYFSELLLMLQKEVGERLIAPPGCKQYGILSVFCQLYFDISKQFIVKPGSFRPIPKVDSMILKFCLLPTPRVDVGDPSLFRSLVKSSFGQRRKTLWNCLKGDALGIGDKELELAFRRSGIDPGRRGETLSLDEFAILTKALAGGETVLFGP